MDGTELEIGLSIWEDGTGIRCITRRMALDEDGTVTDSRYVFNTGSGLDWDWDDEELLRLLDDTLTGMRAEVRHRMRAMSKGMSRETMNGND